MSMNDFDQGSSDSGLHQDVQQLKPRGWWSRNWLWFVFTLLLAVIVLGAGAIYWWLYIRAYRLEACQSVMCIIQTDKELQDLLGQPIRPVYWPSRETVPNARIEESEIDVLWNIEGPKGRAKAHALSKLRQGKWQTIVMEVVLPSGRKVLLTEAGGGAGDAPPFKRPESPTTEPEAEGPAPEINLPIPPNGGPGMP